MVFIGVASFETEDVLDLSFEEIDDTDCAVHEDEHLHVEGVKIDCLHFHLFLLVTAFDDVVTILELDVVDP